VNKNMTSENLCRWLFYYIMALFGENMLNITCRGLRVQFCISRETWIQQKISILSFQSPISLLLKLIYCFTTHNMAGYLHGSWVSLFPTISRHLILYELMHSKSDHEIRTRNSSHYNTFFLLQSKFDIEIQLS